MLAEIEAPDLDQQLLQAQADLASAQANAKLSEATSNRRKTLIALEFRVEAGSRRAHRRSLQQEGAVKADQANVERLEALNGYKHIIAPFDGIVTARDTDVGALINAGGSSGPALFVVSDTKKLRVYVSVPQSYVPAITIGTKATSPCRTSGPDVRGDGRSLVAGGRCRVRHHADAAWRSTSQRRVDAGRLRQRAA